MKCNYNFDIVFCFHCPVFTPTQSASKARVLHIFILVRSWTFDGLIKVVFLRSITLKEHKLYITITAVTVYGQDGELVVNLIHVWSPVMCSGREMKCVIRNTRGDLALRGSCLQTQEVKELQNASAHLQVHLGNITGLQETAVTSTTHEGRVWRKEHYSCPVVNVAVRRTFHIMMQTQDCAMKLVRENFLTCIIQDNTHFKISVRNIAR